MSGPPTRRRWQVADAFGDGNIEIAGLDWGGEGPLALLHHANGFCAATWTLVAQGLTGSHRVVAIDLSDAAFEPDSTEIRFQWRQRLDVLLGELRKAPSVLRLSYVADTEDAALVKRRVAAVQQLGLGDGRGDDRTHQSG